MRDFSTMKSNVGADVQDTSTSFSSIIGRYINKRYLDVLRVCNLQPTNTNYLITLATTMATLPSDFGKELYCIDSTNNNKLQRADVEELTKFDTTMDDTATDPKYYAIYTDQNGAKQIMVWATPDTNIVLKLPYQVRPAQLSADADTPLIPCEDILEVGATADAWRYKRQFAKAQAMEAMYADLLSNLIWDTENQPAYPKQFTPTTYDRDLL